MVFTATMSESSGNKDVAYCGDSLMGVSIAIGVVQILVVAARFYARYLQRVACAVDDYLIIPSLVALPMHTTPCLTLLTSLPPYRLPV